MIHDLGDEGVQVEALALPAAGQCVRPSAGRRWRPVSRRGGFTNRRTEALRSKVEAVSGALLDRLAARGEEEVVDLIEGLAYPLPLRVICELVGVPDELVDAVRRLMNAVVGTPETPEHGEFIQQQVLEVPAALIAYRREHPGENLTSDLIRAVEAEDGPTDDEVEQDAVARHRRGIRDDGQPDRQRRGGPAA